MRSKRAFTLVELIAVITLLAILLILMVPNLTGVANNSRLSLRDSKIRTIVTAGEEFGGDAINKYQACVSSNANLSKECTVSINYLSNNGYIEGDDDDGNILDPVTNAPFQGNVLLCYDPAHVSVYAHYVDDDNYSCKDIAVNSDNTLNLSAINGIGYIGGDDVTVNMVKSGDFTGYRCESDNTKFVTNCSIESINNSRSADDRRVRMKLANDLDIASFGGANYKDVTITVYADYLAEGSKNTLSKKYNLKVYPTDLKIVDEEKNLCMNINSTLNLPLETLNAGTISVESSNSDILEGTTKDGRLYFSSKSNTGSATLSVKEANGKKSDRIERKIFELGLEHDDEADFPKNLVIHKEADVKIKHNGTGTVTISSDKPGIVHFSTSKVSASDSITLSDEDTFKVIAVGTGTAKVTIQGSDCGREERVITVSSLSFKNETSGTMYIGGEDKTVELEVEHAENLRCESSNTNAATCIIDGALVRIHAESEADDDVKLTVSGPDAGVAYYQLKVIETSLEITDSPNGGNTVGTVCRAKGTNTNDKQVYASGKNIGKTSVYDIEDWYLAEAEIAQEGRERFITVFPRNVEVEGDGYILGENTGRTTITIRENNGNRQAGFSYNIYELNTSNDRAQLKVDETTEFDVGASGTGEISVSSSDRDVAIAEVVETSGEFSWTPNHVNTRKIRVTATGTGVATIYVRGADCGMKTFTVTVEGKSLSIVLRPGTYTTSLGSDRLTCKTSGLLRTCEVEFPEIYTTSEFQVVGYSKDKDSTSYNYRPGDKITLNAFNNGNTYYGNSMDVTKPVCSIPDYASNTIIGETTYVTMTCVDTGSGIRGTGALSASNFEVSDSSIGEISEVGSPVKIANGYSYRIGIKSKQMGFYNIGLKANSVTDEFGNGNDGFILQNIFSSEYEMEKAWYIGKVERPDVMAILYDNASAGHGDAGTYSLYIYGRGDMLDFISDEYNYYSPWYEDYKDSITYVQINSGVTNVGGGAFYNLSSLTNVALTEGITYIGNRAFTNCNLSDVTVPNSVTNIGEYAFYGNMNLSSLYLGNKISSIGNAAFYNHHLSTLSIPSSVLTIGELAFGVEFERSVLTTLSFRNNSNLTTIGDMAFIYHSLTTLTLPNSLETIGARAFEQGGNDNSTLRTINFGSSSGLKTIGDDAFAYANISSLTLPDSLENIGARSFAAMREGVTTLTIGRNVKTLGDSFAYGKGLEAFEVDEGNQNFTAVDGVLYTKDLATLVKCPDDYYKNHEKLDVSSFTSTLQKGAFNGWLDYGTNIKGFALNLPTTLTNMNINDNFIFFTLGEINIADNSEFDSVNGVLYNKDHTTIYRLPTAYDASDFSIPSTVTHVANYFSYGNSRIATIEVPESVRDIGVMAFQSDTEYGFETINLYANDTVSFDETSFAVMVYPEGGDISTRTRTINVKNTSLKDRLLETYSSLPYRFIVNRV